MGRSASLFAIVCLFLLGAAALAGPVTVTETLTSGPPNYAGYYTVTADGTIPAGVIAFAIENGASGLKPNTSRTGWTGQVLDATGWNNGQAFGPGYAYTTGAIGSYGTFLENFGDDVGQLAFYYATDAGVKNENLIAAGESSSEFTWISGGMPTSDYVVWLAGGQMLGPFDTNDDGNPIPEPGSLALVGLGLAGLAAWRRRRGKRAPPG